MSPHPLLHRAVALDGAGWHPAAWREPDARPTELFRGRYRADLVAEAEDGLLDFVTSEDSFGIQSTAFNTEADELIITTITHDHADRVASYRLPAEEWARRGERS